MKSYSPSALGNSNMKDWMSICTGHKKRPQTFHIRRMCFQHSEQNNLNVKRKKRQVNLLTKLTNLNERLNPGLSNTKLKDIDTTSPKTGRGMRAHAHTHTHIHLLTSFILCMENIAKQELCLIKIPADSGLQPYSTCLVHITAKITKDCVRTHPLS